MNFRNTIASMLFAVLSAAVPAHAALLEGNTISKQRYYPDLDSQIDVTGYHLVGSGKEIDAMQVLDSGGISYDFSDTNIRMSWEYFTQFEGFAGIPYSAAQFNGVAFSDVFRRIDDFKSVTLRTNVVGLIEDRVSFNANEIYINWQGLTILSTDFISLELNELPEPSSLALLGLAVAGLGFARRRA